MKKISNDEFKKFISEEIKNLQKQDLVESYIDYELSLLKESDLTMDIFNNPEELKKFRENLIKKAAGWNFAQPEMLSEKYGAVNVTTQQALKQAINMNTVKPHGKTTSDLEEDVKVSEKNFFVKDLSGRGYTANLSEEDIRASWDLEEEDWDNEESLGYFIENAEVGDEWKTNSVKITRTE